MSMRPIREALITLDHEGVVEHIARRGAFVARMTRDDIRDHFRVFGVVSGLAAERAAKNLSPESLQAMHDLADRMESAVDRADQERLNFEFHRRINYAADSRRLLSLLGILGKTVSHGFYEARGLAGQGTGRPPAGPGGIVGALSRPGAHARGETPRRRGRARGRFA
ncbi:GntR family transcriptional regulator [Amycolatopsis sp. NPDC003676]